MFKRILFLFLFFLSAQAQAQDDTVYDSVNIVADEEQEPSTAMTASDQQYFLSKEGTDSDSFYVQVRDVPDTVIKKMRQDDAFWYVDAAIEKEQPEKVKRSDYVPLGGQKWFQTLLWLIIIGGFAAAIMWYLASSNIGLFRRKNVQSGTDADTDEMPENIFEINYQKEIDKAAAQGNYRLAVRLMFLRALKTMAEKNIIQYKQDRTNLDYLFQLQSSVYYNNFFRITRNYEYSWYGQFQVGEEAYKIIRSDFDQFDRQLR